jgi:cytochrome c-type biogenesis protein CcmH/NrfG
MNLKLVAVGSLACLGLLTAGVFFYNRQAHIPPSLPDLSGADSEVAEAVTAAGQEVQKRPRSARAWGHLGMVLSAHGFLFDANLAFAEAERLDPKDPRWPYLHGVDLILSDPSAAISHLERAVERCGDESTPRLLLAEVILEQGWWEVAERHLNQVLTGEPENRRAQLDLGRLALLREDWPGALTYLAACRDDEHCRKLARKLIARVYRRQGQRKQAEAEETQAVALPDDESWPDPYVAEMRALQCGLQARIERADAMSRQDKNEAIRFLQETAARYPRSVQVWLGLGGLWLQLGNKAQAEQAFRRAVEVDPNAAEGWFRLGCIQALDRPEEAAESFRQAIKLKPDHALAHFNLGHRLKQLGDLKGAAEEFHETLRCRPDYTPAREALQELQHSRRTP